MEAVLCRGLRAAREIAVGNVNGSRERNNVKRPVGCSHVKPVHCRCVFTTAMHRLVGTARDRSLRSTVLPAAINAPDRHLRPGSRSGWILATACPRLDRGRE